MKGVVLAGGMGSRLDPLTRVTNKHLLPIYNKPMIYYPLLTMKEAGVTEVMIVSGPEHVDSFSELLGNGEEFGMKFEYKMQEKPGGIGQALGLTREFVGEDKFIVILGDNVIEDNLSEAVASFDGGSDGAAKIFLKEVDNPSAYGVAEVSGEKVDSLVEKPEDPKSNLAIIGCYMYDAGVFDVIAGLEPSDRGELEITDVNNHYLGAGKLEFEVLEGFWGDCGESFDGMLEVSQLIKNSRLK
jgi:glucose-1-phosphate thymidylyltransferase